MLRASLLHVSLMLFFPFVSWANLASSYEAIKNQPRYYKDPGAVCEEVARNEFSLKYPAPQYEVIVGVAYNLGGRTLGELDLVILDKTTEQIEIVGEVKCYENLKKGLNKARQQRKRFLSNLSQSGEKLVFINTSTEKTVPNKMFRTVKTFLSVSQKGGEVVGFDHELEHSLDEMSELRDMVIKCQQRQECPLP